jgi:class 3 adenylate cyclase
MIAQNEELCSTIRRKPSQSPPRARGNADAHGPRAADRISHRYQPGDVIVDGVNFAARLENLAEPGGIGIAANVL